MKPFVTHPLTGTPENNLAPTDTVSAPPTPEPTWTPEPTAPALPLPTPATAATLTIAKAERLYDCIQTNPGYAALYEGSIALALTTQGLTEEAAARTTELILASKENFAENWQQAIDAGLQSANVLESEIQICETDAVARDAESFDLEAETDILYYCLQYNQEYQEQFRSNLIASMRRDGVQQVAAEDLATFMMSTPENFRTFVGEAAKADPTLRSTLETGLQDCTASSRQAAPLSDRDILVIFYKATGGPNWTNNENWLSSKPIGEWFGVTTDESGRVIELVRTFADNMIGEIPPEIGMLDELRKLNLSGELTGTIPPEIGNLSKLEELLLMFNELTGEIPPELGQLSNLKRLQLTGNNLYGEIPPELANLRNLEGLNLAINELDGRIPPELGQLQKLEWLGLNNNLLRGEIPPELGDLENLIELVLQDNFLIGQVPTELGNLSRMEYLGIFNTGITGCIPNSLQDQLTDHADLGDLPFCPTGSQPAAGPTQAPGPTPISASQLFREAGSGRTLTEPELVGKVVAVKGKVVEIRAKDSGHSIFLLAGVTGSTGNLIVCEAPGSQSEAISRLSGGDEVTLVGSIAEGVIGYPHLVYLSDCRVASPG